MGSRYADVVDAALVVAARDGLANLSMRAVATQVGVTVMALYRHLPNKEGLLDAMVGRMLSEVELPAAELEWTEQLRWIARQMLALAERYPTVVPLLLTRTYNAPEAIRLVEVQYEILDRAGVPRRQVYRLERMFSTQLLGYCIAVANNGFWASEPTSLTVGNVPDRRATAGRRRWASELDDNVTSFCRLVREEGRLASGAGQARGSRAPAKRRT